MSPLLLAAGYVNLDVIATVERVPGFGERVTAGSIFRATGGMTANAACAAARLGLGTAFFGRVGNDTEGEAALAELRRFGVGEAALIALGRSCTMATVQADSGYRLSDPARPAEAPVVVRPVLEPAPLSSAPHDGDNGWT